MVIRVLIFCFTSLAVGSMYAAGLIRLTTALIVGFGVLCSLFLGVLFLFPVDKERLLLPVYEQVPAWPYLLLAVILAAMLAAFFLYRSSPVRNERADARHFKLLTAGFGCYLASVFLSSLFWFPSDAKRLAASAESLRGEVLGGTILFLCGVCLSCYLLYRASKGNTVKSQDLMRRLVLSLFAVLQLDKVPLLVAYLLLYSPETEVVFPNIAALALSAYLPVSLFLIQTSRETHSGE
ncbi:MAG: hypothetical protein CSB32_00915 [Desulfobacterales bacterium]|nr:MAG: hypothetical protein CSB32_00915 [Desulfobacterales bacterium]